MGDDGEVNVIDGGVVERDGGEGVQEEKHDPVIVLFFSSRNNY